jgi:hypothetical protein
MVAAIVMAFLMVAVGFAAGVLAGYAVARLVGPPRRSGRAIEATE